MSSKATNQADQQLRLEMQNELTITNQLLHAISVELQILKEYTRSGGTFETNVAENANTMERLGAYVSVNNADIENINPVRDGEMDTSQQSEVNQN